MKMLFSWTLTATALIFVGVDLFHGSVISSLVAAAAGVATVVILLRFVRVEPGTQRLSWRRRERRP